MNYMNFVIIGVVVLLVLGFLIGFLRNWKKSLTRFIILLCCLLFSLFLSPVITEAFLKNSVQGTTVSIFSFNIDIGGMIASMLNNPDIANDLAGADAATNQLVTAVVRVVGNLAIFLVMFIILYLISLLIYAIVFAVLSSKRKKKGIKDVKNGKYWGLKTLSGFIGMFGMFMIAFVFMIPAFGVLKICSYFEAEKNNTPTTSAYNYESYMGDNFANNKNENQVTTYIDKIVDIKSSYDNSFIGKCFNFFGVSKLGESAFGYLTNVKVDSINGTLNFNLTDELSSIIYVYNIYNSELSGSQIDITNEQNLKTIEKMYDGAVKSEVLKSYITELLPKLSEKWSEPNGKFLGIECPGGEYKDIVIDAIGAFNTKNFTEINSTIKSLISGIKVANKYQFIQVLQEDGKIEDFFADTENENFLSEFITELTKTNKLKETLPNLLNDFISIAYDGVFEENKGGLQIDKTQIINVTDWNAEALRIQNIINNLFSVLKDLNSGTETVAFIDKLENFGTIMDNAKNSEVLSKSLHKFMYDYLNSKIDLDEKVKTEVLKALGTPEEPSSNWTDPSFSYEVLFRTLHKTYEVAKELQEGAGSESFDALKDVIESAIEDGSVKDTVQGLLNSGIIDDVIKDDETGMGQTIKDVVDKMFDTEKTGDELKESLEKDFDAGKKLLDMLQHDTGEENNNNLFGSGEEGSYTADEFVDSLQSSDAVWGMLKDQASKEDGSENKAIQDAIKDKLTSEDQQALKKSLDKKLADDEPGLKEKLEKYLGLNDLPN